MATEQLGSEGRRLSAAPTQEELSTGVKFFGNRICPYANRSWWSLVELGVDFDYIHIDLGDSKPEWYKQVNPFGTVPALYDNGKPVFESLIVSEFINDRFGGEVQILPQDPHERAAVRLFIVAVDKAIPNLYKLLRAQTDEEKEQHRAATRESLASLNSSLKRQSEGPFFLGDRLSLADISLVPFLDRFVATLEYYRDFVVLPEGDDTVDRLRQLYFAAKERPAFQQTSQPSEFYIEFYRKYAQPSS